MNSVIPLSHACPAGRRYPVIPLKIKTFFLCALSSVLLVFSFPNCNLWILAWFGFVPLFFALTNKTKLQSFFLAYLTGIIFWTGIIYWLVHVTLPGTILLILYLALYFGIFGLLISAYSLQLTAYSFLFIPSAWVLLEYIRSHLFTGFPWALLGNSQYLNLPVIQIADITGAYGVSFLVMMVNVFIYSVMCHVSCVMCKRQKPAPYSNYLLVILFLFLSFSYGLYKLPTTHDPRPTTFKVSVIQGNIPQELKWNPESQDYIVNKYINLTAEAAKDRPDLIIWPEAALPVVLEEEPKFFEKVKSFTQEINTPLLLGAVTGRDNFYYNSAILICAASKLLTRYDKLHLVPFGEYIPLKKVLPFLETVVPIGDITAGREYTVFAHDARRTTQDSRRFSVLICFEDLFPELSRQFVKKGAQFLVNITNDAWYKRSSAAQQHFQASVFRAVENRVYLVRSANTGVSGFISPSGKIISLVQDKFGRDIFVDGYGTKELFLFKRNLTFYTRFGDVFIVACVLFVLYGIIPKFKNLRHKTWRIRQ